MKTEYFTREQVEKAYIDGWRTGVKIPNWRSFTAWHKYNPGILLPTELTEGWQQVEKAGQNEIFEVAEMVLTHALTKLDSDQERALAWMILERCGVIPTKEEILKAATDYGDTSADVFSFSEGVKFVIDKLKGLTPRTGE